MCIRDRLWDDGGNGFRCLSWEFAMTLGLAPKQGDLLRSTVGYCEGRVAADSIYGVLHRQCFALFPDEMFADLFTDVGRRSVPPTIVAVVMVLQRIEGCSDREGRGPVRVRHPVEVRRGRSGLRLPGVRAHRAGRHAGPAGRLAASGPDLRGDPWRRPGPPGWWGANGSWTPPRCTTRSPRWTP